MDAWHPMRIEVSGISRQFVVQKEGSYETELQGERHASLGWELLTCSLPVTSLNGRNGELLGWCIGYPVRDGLSGASSIQLPNCSAEFIDDSDVEALYSETGGRFAVLIITERYKRFYGDPYGSLGAVFLEDAEIIASTTSLLPGPPRWDQELISLLGMPESGLWYPSGLTARVGAKRLLPNQYLDLEGWQSRRYWPAPTTDLSADGHPLPQVKEIVETIAASIRLATEERKGCLSLTAGRDSRMLLACAREYVSRLQFFTFDEGVENRDLHISRKIAKEFGLEYRTISVATGTDEDARKWLTLTGHAVAGPILRVHKSLESMDPQRVLMPGMAGEVGRAFYWRDHDRSDSEIDACEVLRRCGLPVHPRTVSVTKQWLDSLPVHGALRILDFVYLEQRLGCWAAPQHYGNLTSKFEFSPFNHRRVFTSMMRLPFEYRRDQRLAVDVCRIAWPDLLKLPFNEYTGLKGVVLSRARRIKKSLKKIMSR